jgi:signal transduction histidine kinase
MTVRDWLRPPRHLLAAFFGVALVSAGTLAWLAVQVVRQDAALETQRQRERLEQAADRTAAFMQQSLSALDPHLGGALPSTDQLPPHVSFVAIEARDVQLIPDKSLPYVPGRASAVAEQRELFAEGERREFAARDLSGARAEYQRLAGTSHAAIRAGALVRLARIARKRQDLNAALQMYERLERMGLVTVDDLPAGLVARVGRASLFAENGRRDELVSEAAALQRDLHGRRWPITKSEYEFYTRQADEWAGARAAPDPDALARAEAVDWLWQNRAALPSTSRRVLMLTVAPSYVTWRASPRGVIAIAGGPDFLQALCDTGSDDVECSIVDVEGRVLIGHRPVSRFAALRTASAAGLPWTLQIAGARTASSAPSPRRRFVVAAFAIVLLVLVAGWYFIVRAISRELRVSRLQSDFVAAVSHEFRSPLTSLSHIAEMLAHDRFASDAIRRKAYDVLVRDTDRLRRLVEGLLEFGRMESGDAALRLTDVDIAALVQSTVSEFEGRAAAEGFHIDLTIGASDLVVRADRDALSRAVANLLDNAVKYSPDCRTVWVTVEHESTFVSVSVRDRGFGIPADEQHDIFDRFVRGAGPKLLRIRGTGIGLAMVREIVRAHGGAVRLASEPQQGSTFTIVLPLVQERARARTWGVERDPTRDVRRSELVVGRAPRDDVAWASHERQIYAHDHARGMNTEPPES